MSVQEQAGQVLIADYASIETATALIRDLNVGGVILMGKERRVGRSGTRGHRCAPGGEMGAPLAVGVDQEAAESPESARR